MPRATVWLGYELQQLKVLIAFRIRQLRNPHVVTGHSEQKWIGEQEVCIGDVADEVIADAERQA